MAATMEGTTTMSELLRKVRADAYVAWRDGRYSRDAFRRILELTDRLS